MCTFIFLVAAFLCVVSVDLGFMGLAHFSFLILHVMKLMGTYSFYSSLFGYVEYCKIDVKNGVLGFRQFLFSALPNC